MKRRIRMTREELAGIVLQRLKDGLLDGIIGNENTMNDRTSRAFIENGNAILQELIEERVSVTVYLMNGFQLRGTITGCDEDVLVIVVDGKQQMLYKHGISTIAPHPPPNKH